MNGNGRPDVPVWLLDVDGVLNASSRPGWHAQPTRRYAYAGGHEFKFRWAPSLIDALHALIRSDLVEVRWATSWINDIGQVNRLLTMPLDLPLAFALPTDLRPATDALHDAAEDAKRTAALDIARAGRRLLWTDDEAIFPIGTSERDELITAGALLIEPDARRGLQPEHIEAIRTWLGAE